MIWLVIGVVLWAYSHLMKRLTPGIRAGLGDRAGKGVAAVLALLAVGAMIYGYKQAEVVVLWQPPDFLRHVNNLLMLAAVVLVGLGASRGVLRSKIRHPMLSAVKVWALAHLLVNGDLASVVLFGGLLAWAVVQLIVINRQEPVWNRPAAGPLRNDLIYAVVALGAFAVITVIHNWLGVSPFG